MTAAGPIAEPATTSGAPGPIVRFLVLTLLAVDGVLCAVVAALLLPAHIGTIPFPLSALIGGLVNAALVWVALRCTSSLRLAALPLWTWLVTIALMTLGGPGDDLIFADRGLLAYGVLLLILLGSAPPAWLLWRRRQAMSAGPRAGER